MLELTATEAESLIKRISPDLGDAFSYETIFTPERSDVCVVKRIKRIDWRSDFRYYCTGNYCSDTIYLVWKNPKGIRYKKIKNGHGERIYINSIVVTESLISINYNWRFGFNCALSQLGL